MNIIYRIECKKCGQHTPVSEAQAYKNGSRNATCPHCGSTEETVYVSWRIHK